MITPATDPCTVRERLYPRRRPDARVLSELSDADTRALDGVIAALGRLDAGSYGICAACHQPIEPARQRLLPEAAECAECARFAEDTRRRLTADLAPRPVTRWPARGSGGGSRHRAASSG